MSHDFLDMESSHLLDTMSRDFLDTEPVKWSDGYFIAHTQKDRGFRSGSRRKNYQAVLQG
ncbi:hypothetical protein CYJ46_05590 [Corynebacterium coyleae]|nr:hypothetical protein CYJ46_05590 [Corynebacterium coyleae]